MDIVDLQQWRELVQGGNALWWAQGEYVDAAVREAGESARELLGVLAQEANCTITSLKQKAEVYRAFEPGMRRPEKPPTWHRALRQAALRTKQPLADVLKDAVEKDYGQRELDALGTQGKQWATWGGTCPDCNAKVNVRMMREMAGAEIVCPRCAVEHGNDTKYFVSVLGRLQ
jgi:hypothetical protein